MQSMKENVSTLIQHRPDFQTDIRRDSKKFFANIKYLMQQVRNRCAKLISILDQK